MQRRVLVEGYTTAGRKIVESGMINNGYQPTGSSKPAPPPQPPKGGSAVSKPSKNQ